MVYCPIKKDKHWIIFDARRAKIAESNLDWTLTRGLKLWAEESGALSAWGSNRDKSFFYKLAERHCPVTLTEAKFQL